MPVRYHARNDGGEWDVLDPYSFGPVLGPMDDYYIGEGSHLRLFDKLGAHAMSFEGVAGTHFAVWAPNARRVSVVGPFNEWDGRRHPMRIRLNAQAAGMHHDTGGSLIGHHRLFDDFAPAQHRPHPRDQFPHAERLR